MELENPFHTREKIFNMIIDATQSGELQWRLRKEDDLTDFVYRAKYRNVGLWIADTGIETHISFKFNGNVVAYRLYENDCQRLLEAVKRQIQKIKAPFEATILQQLETGYMEKENEKADLVPIPSALQEEMNQQPSRRFRFRLREGE